MALPRDKVTKFSGGRIGEKLKREIKEIQLKRCLTIDRDLPKPIGAERITNAIPTIEPEWTQLKIKLLRMPREEK